MLCAAVIFTSTPLSAFAQSSAHSAVQGSTEAERQAEEKPKPDLRASLAEATAKIRNEANGPRGFNRLEKDQLNPQNNAKRKPWYIRKNTILLAGFIVAMVGLALVVNHNYKPGAVSCYDDPSDLNCI